MSRWIKATNTDEGKTYAVEGIDKVFDDYWDAWDCAKDTIESLIGKRQDLTLIGSNGDSGECEKINCVDGAILVIVSSEGGLELFNDACEFMGMPMVTELGTYARTFNNFNKVDGWRKL